MNSSMETAKMPARPHPAVVVAILLLLVLMSGIVLPLVQIQIISLAAATLFVLLIPLWIESSTDWFSVWNWVVYAAAIGILGRSVFIAFDLPSEQMISSLFLLGRTKEFLIIPHALMLLGMLLLTSGYLFFPSDRQLPIPQLLLHDHWRHKRLFFLVAFLLVIAWLSFAGYVSQTGGLDLARLSAKRTVAANLGEYSAHGYFRWGMKMASLATVLLFTGLISRRRRWFFWLLFLPFFGTSVFFATYASSRGDILLLLLHLLAISYYVGDFRGKRMLRLRYLMPIGLVFLFALGALTALRRSLSLAESFRVALSLEGAVFPLFLNLHFMDVSKTAHIFAAVQKGVLQHEWGWTFLTWTFAWIPRSLWSGKPIVSVDQIIGPLVFTGTQRIGATGVPPGFFAEAYWNFGVYGVIGGGLVVGVVLRLLYVSFRPHLKYRNALLVYVLVFMTFGMTLLSSSVSGTMIQTLREAVPLFLALLFISKSDPVSTSKNDEHHARSI